MRLIRAHHPQWTGHLLISTTDDQVHHQEHGDKGRYTLRQDRLTVYWETYAPEVFVRRAEDDSFVFAERLAAAPTTPQAVTLDSNAPPLDYLVLTTQTPLNALVRLQSQPLLQGLASLGWRTRFHHYPHGTPVTVPPASAIIVHYLDPDALTRAAALKALCGARLYCLSSDIYDIDTYTRIAPLADAFFAPTPLHAELLRAAQTKPVFVLPEAIDPIAQPTDGTILPPAATDRLCWFGYPESFAKSCRHLLPHALDDAEFPAEKLALITAPNVSLLAGAEHIPFSPERFYTATAPFRYALLSHFVFDNHINTFIKSPNKLVTALARGLAPVASNTIHYRPLMREYGLENWMFSSPHELATLLRKIKTGAAPDPRLLRLAAEDLRAQLAPERLARQFLAATLD
ncbi:hypothetical protein [Acidocella sp.]|uniref:hypothetical protein n=1 Tax=Acidocella sp. TaxID=50710 RepID=UPI00262E2D1B|nr:hypothetical protein [Acidocella sp.]